MKLSLDGGGTCTLDVDGEPTTFTDDEVSVSMDSKSGYAAASGSKIAAVLATELTPELVAEGIAREIVHHVQGLRKEADLDYQARIRAHVRCDDQSILDALEGHKDYIMSETLSSTLVTSDFDDGQMKIWNTGKVNGVKVDFGIMLDE
jgi:isoleucyl-tRNA synthetase